MNIKNIQSTSNFTMALKASAAGINVNNRRLRNISENLANAGTSAATPGSDPYARKTISFGTKRDKNGADIVAVSNIGRDSTPFPTVYKPGDPGADERGFVKQTNVNALIEMADGREAGISHASNISATKKLLDMYSNLMSLLKR